MKEDRIRWNQKYRSRTPSPEPAPIVVRHHRLATIGRALDIAAGNGGNALFLAQHGFQVEAVDISDEALLRLAGRHPRAQPICADLDRFDIPENRYDLIVNIRFLNRRLFPFILAGLKPGGVLIFETYLEGPLRDDARSCCRDYLLRPNELLHAFIGLRILFYSEERTGSTADGRASAALVALKQGSG